MWKLLGIEIDSIHRVICVRVNFNYGFIAVAKINKIQIVISWLYVRTYAAYNDDDNISIFIM